MQTNNLSITQQSESLNWKQKAGLAMAGIGLLILLLAWSGVNFQPKAVFLYGSLLAILIGTSINAWEQYMHRPAGIQNNGVWFRSLTNRGAIGWVVGIVLTGFYVLLYWFPSYIGFNKEGTNSGLTALFDPLSQFFTGTPASQWFVYGTLYTLAILALGIKFLIKYRHSKHHFWRTVSVIIAQLFLAYLIPQMIQGLNEQDVSFSKDIKLFWPLNYYFFDEWHLKSMLTSGTLGMFYLVVGILMFTLFTPILSYFVGKRWYCSWVCGCGGLAETAGDPFRHLSTSNLFSWKVERWLIHGVLVFVILMTGGVLYGYFSGADKIFGFSIYNYLRQPYGFLIGAIFSGIVGVGFYPLLGNRVWCRFGCPLAAYIGMFQRFKSKFRITTNGDQCISCGNCSTYCEQGIDVKYYAQRGQNIVRSSCVGCGICSAVCPRGVLRLENGPDDQELRTGIQSVYTSREEEGVFSAYKNEK